MTTITDELAAALKPFVELYKFYGDTDSVIRCYVDAGRSSKDVDYTAFGDAAKSLAKYEAAKAQECRAIPGIELALHQPGCAHEEKGFPVVKVPGHVVNHMEWKDHALIVTVGPRQAQEPAPSKSDIWNFVTSASNFIQELKNGIEALQHSTVTGLSQNIAGLATTAAARSIFIEEWRKRLLPENYPAAQEPSDLVNLMRDYLSIAGKDKMAVIDTDTLCEAVNRIEALEAAFKTGMSQR